MVTSSEASVQLSRTVHCVVPMFTLYDCVPCFDISMLLFILILLGPWFTKPPTMNICFDDREHRGDFWDGSGHLPAINDLVVSDTIYRYFHSLRYYIRPVCAPGYIVRNFASCTTEIVTRALEFEDRMPSSLGGLFCAPKCKFEFGECSVGKSCWYESCIMESISVVIKNHWFFEFCSGLLL